MSQSSKPVPLAVPNELLAQIDAAAAATGRTRSELMRLAIEVGLEDLRRIDYDLSGVIVDAAALTKTVTQRGRKGPGLKELEVPLKDYSAALLSPQTAKVAESPENHPIAEAPKKPVSYRSTPTRKK